MKHNNQKCPVPKCPNKRWGEFCFTCTEKLPEDIKAAMSDTWARRHADPVAYAKAVGDAKKHFAMLHAPPAPTPAPAVPDHSRYLGEKPE